VLLSLIQYFVRECSASFISYIFRSMFRGKHCHLMYSVGRWSSQCQRCSESSVIWE